MNPSSADREEHLSDELVLRYIDDELREEERREVERHLEACAPCAARRRTLREASSRLSRSLRALDVPPPDPEPPAAMALDPPDGARAAPGEAGREEVPAGRRRLLVAAMLLLTTTGIGLAAVPGSPVRDWIVRSAERATALFSSGDEDETDVAAAASTESAAGAVSVGSREERLVISLTDPRPALLRLRLVSGERATVRAPGARYLASPGRLEVVGAQSGVILLELPVDVSTARVEVDGRAVLVREDGELRFRVPSVDSAGSEFTFPIGGSDGP